MSELLGKQKLFALRLAFLLKALDEHEYSFTLGEVYRPEITAQYYARLGKGSATSLHCQKLAADIQLFKDGKYLTQSEDYRLAGELWEAMSTSFDKCAWGGHWGDGNHFSIEYGGMR